MEQLDLKKAVVNNSWFDPDRHKEMIRQKLKEQGVI
jgi:basic membrane lipoprotein Med (substrate-binding protein (PBP1-ABC) superfamily)